MWQKKEREWWEKLRTQWTERGERWRERWLFEAAGKKEQSMNSFLLFYILGEVEIHAKKNKEKLETEAKTLHCLLKIEKAQRRDRF